MIKISNEIKIGAVALITIVAFIWLYNFLKGKDFFKNTVNYYCIYDEIGGLAESSPVEINGYKVGVVQSIGLLDESSGKLLATFSVSKDFKLPTNTVAEIVPVSIIAGMKVQFLFGEGPGTYSPGDTIPGRLTESLLTTIETELFPVKKRIEDLLDVLDSVVVSIDEILTPEFKESFESSVVNLGNITGSVDNILGSKEKELKETLDNISRFSQMLSDNSDNMGDAINNLKSVTDTLAAADIYTSVSNLKTSLENTSQLLENLNEGKGSAGQLLVNDTLYMNLSSSLENLNLLLEDLKANPKKYVHFSLFGRK